MADKPEKQTRAEIDWLPTVAGRPVHNYKGASIQAVRGVALRKSSLKELYDGKDCLFAQNHEQRI